MPKKYYCDYCCKSFQDTPKARKRHFSGLSHQRQRKYYYETVIIPAASNNNTTALLWSRMSGEEMLQEWLKCNPGMQKRIFNESISQ
uniref:U1-C C2H2-type zinc finger domain-containing protein n=1 Tax=Amphimedon queenslandica TaxID=400682 RepID=A0A1X7U5N4_AMPQE